MAKTWFITGTSKGFGREWAYAALDRGDNVAGTARDVATLEDLVKTYPQTFLPLHLDVTDRAEAFASIAATVERFGSLDVVVNNAGYGHFGMVEELTEQELRNQLETNFYGTVWITQAALPVMRSQRSGHIVQVTSEGGVTAFPGIGAYHASKWAVEGLSQSLAQEVASFGIHVTMLEPGPYATDWLGVGAIRSDSKPAYDPVRAAIEKTWGPDEVGTPSATRPAILTIVDSEAPPLRAFFGAAALAEVAVDYESRLATWNDWQTVAVAASGSTPH